MTEIMPVPRNLSFTVLPAGRLGSVIFIYFVEFIYSATVFAGSAESIQ